MYSPAHFFSAIFPIGKILAGIFKFIEDIREDQLIVTLIFVRDLKTLANFLKEFESLR